ncbi:flavin monoamine oxidase family protein [Rhodopila sp.]|uniref:flavin monoamine oxidase family protein n=1 Tax=Rhodopila sp. TaxID=2480087 RepID=UPI002BF38F55|nr:NAD(P)/FAD-dependent oxidoreductase [Rhodopila sp.]HVZ09866.1 NAD(P)/FAD-dependent oxidoreductase [Rhodopila sp.]
MTDTEIVIIGAGLAGLGAAAAARDAGRRAVVLEASGRVGGRAWTTGPPQFGGQWFDMGAIWFHDAEHNPLTGIAQAAGDTLLCSDALRQELTFVGDRPATPVELAEYAAAWPRFEAKADALLADRGDVPLAEVARHLPDDPWAATVEAWEGPVICAADADQFSALDWRRNALGGSNLVPDGGIGAFVARRLTGGLDIRLRTPARTVRWGGPGGRVTVETDAGTLTAGACIVTVSTGVLGSGALCFDPALPAVVTDAVHDLPMGLAIKVVLGATGPDRLGLASHTSVDRRVGQSGDVLMPVQCWPFGRDYVQGWIGGSPAWELARLGQAACVDFAVSYLRRLFGGRVDRLFGGGASLVTQWDQDPWIRGAYCYATPGHADARHTLAAPVSGGHLMFAGEACHVGFAGTVAGAWISGQRAARTAIAALGDVAPVATRAALSGTGRFSGPA